MHFSLLESFETTWLRSRHIEVRLEKVAAFLRQVRTDDATGADHDAATKGLASWPGAWESIPHGLS